jgi:hypothetical protein
MGKMMMMIWNSLVVLQPTNLQSAVGGFCKSAKLSRTASPGLLRNICRHSLWCTPSKRAAKMIDFNIPGIGSTRTHPWAKGMLSASRVVRIWCFFMAYNQLATTWFFFFCVSSHLCHLTFKWGRTSRRGISIWIIRTIDGSSDELKPFSDGKQARYVVNDGTADVSRSNSNNRLSKTTTMVRVFRRCNLLANVCCSRRREAYQHCSQKGKHEPFHTFLRTNFQGREYH